MPKVICISNLIKHFIKIPRLNPPLKGNSLIIPYLLLTDIAYFIITIKNINMKCMLFTTQLNGQPIMAAKDSVWPLDHAILIFHSQQNN